MKVKVYEKPGVGIGLRRDDCANPCECDLIIVIGGDGTLLRALEEIRCDTPPILTVKAGRRSYLMEVSLDQLEDAIKRFEKGEYSLESWRRLRFGDHYALNEFAILAKSGRVGSFDLIVNGEPIYPSLEGDGVIVSTTVGSTAYALSAGGPIIYPTFETIVVVPVNPLQLNAVPLVLSPSDKVLVKVHTPEAVVYRDGVELGHFEDVEVELSGPRVNFVRFGKGSRVRELLYQRVIS